jgi:hypothetical protein
MQSALTPRLLHAKAKAVFVAQPLRCAVLCCAVQVIVAESYGGNDEPVDTLMANMVGVGAEVGDKPWGAGENSTHGGCGCCGEGEVV